MHYRKNHNSVTGPTWKYPRYKRACIFWMRSNISLQVLRVCGLRSGKGLALRRRALGSLLQGVHALPHQLYFHWSVHVPGYLGCPVDQDAFFTFHCVEDPDLLCTCHQATLRLSTGTFTSWQTKLVSLNGTTRM